MESDLQVHCGGIDYRDRWRFDSGGRRMLTLRRIGVFLRHLPPDSATVLATGGSGWVVGDYLLAHLWQATTGQPHPALPEEEPVVNPEREKARARAKLRAVERQRAIDAGEII